MVPSSRSPCSPARPASLARLDDAVYDISCGRPARPLQAASRSSTSTNRACRRFGNGRGAATSSARLIDRLRDRGGCDIGLDIDLRRSRSQWTGGRGTADASLAEPLARRPRHPRLRPDIRPEGIASPAPACCTRSGSRHPPSERDADQRAVLHATGAVCNLPMLGEAVGRLRLPERGARTAMASSARAAGRRLDGRVYPSLALARGRGHDRRDAIRPSRRNVNAAELDDRRPDRPCRRQGNLLLRLPRRRSAPSPTSRRRTCSSSGFRAGLYATRSCSSGPPRSVRAKSSRRRSIRCSPASRCRPRSPTTCCSRTSSAGRRSERRWKASWRSCWAWAMATLVATSALAAGLAAAAIVTRRLCGGARLAALVTRRCSCRRCPRRRPIVGAVAAMTLAKFTVERRRADDASREKTTAQRLMVQTLLSLTEVRDAETGRHSRRTQQYARLLAEQLATHPEFRDLSHAANGSICCRAWRRCTTSARSACPITSSTSRAR